MTETEDMTVVEWHPARLLQPLSDESTNLEKYTLIILNQPLVDTSALRCLWANASYRVAADGGANGLLDIPSFVPEPGSGLHNKLNVIIGDLDSLSPMAREYFTSTTNPSKVIHQPDQYSTDFAKAVEHARIQLPGCDIVAVGGLGGRVDQGLSQLHHLYLFQTDPRYAQGRMYLFSGESLTFLLKSGSHRIWVRNGREVFGKHVGIIPVKEPSVITIKGFEWDVTEWKTEFGGQISTSNHILPESKFVEVQTDKDVLFTVALKQ